MPHYTGSNLIRCVSTIWSRIESANCTGRSSKPLRRMRRIQNSPSEKEIRSMDLKTLHAQYWAECKAEYNDTPPWIYQRPKSFEMWLAERLEAAEAKLNKIYIDENETVWTVPTAEAYAKTCKALHAKEEKLKKALDVLKLANHNASHRRDCPLVVNGITPCNCHVSVIINAMQSL